MDLVFFKIDVRSWLMRATFCIVKQLLKIMLIFIQVLFVLVLFLNYAFASDMTQYVLLSHKLHEKKKASVEVNNLSNVDSNGFLSDKVLSKSKRGRKSKVFMPCVRRTYVSRDDSAIKETGRELDVAILGYGFFKVLTTQGPRYTLCGSMHVDSERILVDSEGNAFLDEQEDVISVDANYNSVVISRKGSIFLNSSGKNVFVGRLAIVYPKSPQNLLKCGKGLMINVGEEVNASDYDVLQKSINLSNVNTEVSLDYVRNASSSVKFAENMINQYNDLNNKILNSNRR